MEQHSKTFDKVICAVDIFGKFNGRIEVFECDCKDTDEEQWERIWCFDEEQNIYTFYLTASDKNYYQKYTRNLQMVKHVNLIHYYQKKLIYLKKI